MLYYFRFLLENSSCLYFLRGCGGSPSLRRAHREAFGSGVLREFFGARFKTFRHFASCSAVKGVFSAQEFQMQSSLPGLVERSPSAPLLPPLDGAAWEGVVSAPQHLIPPSHTFSHHPSTTTTPRASSTCTGMGRGGPMSLPWSSQLMGIRRQERPPRRAKRRRKSTRPRQPNR